MSISLPPYETIALVLQGGGALGAYQAGVFEGLQEAGVPLNRLAGISIGALNAAIIAGNAPQHRLERLRGFWETICQPNTPMAALPAFVEQSIFNVNDTTRQLLGHMNASRALLDGQNGFFRPRVPAPLPPFGKAEPSQASYYDISPLKDTLERLCDFDRLNDSELHVSVGAVNVRTGNFVFFDNRETRLRAEHFMASGALPPAFPPVEIDGEYYWDGGLVSNTPLGHVLQGRPMRDTLAFQVDLWSARGAPPTNMSEVSDRLQDIRYSSRTRFVTEHFRQSQEMRHLLWRMLQDIPEEVRSQSHYVQLAERLGTAKCYNVVHLILRNQPYDLQYKDYQFGMAAMRERWQHGLADIRKALSDPERLAMPSRENGFVTHDVHREEIEQRMGR
jgi:NTE family protein